MLEQRRWVGILAALFAVCSAACTAVDCPSGSVVREGHCAPDVLGQTEAGGAPSGAGGGAAIEGVVAGSDGSSVAGGSSSAGVGVPSSGAGVPMAGSSGAGGAPIAGSGIGSNAGSGAMPGEPCATPGMLRCSLLGAGNREACMDGMWTTGEACPVGQTCTADASGMPTCVAVAALCKGSGGQTVCDAQGSLVVCNADETIAMQMACKSTRHCQAGMAMQTCAMCLPNEDFQCSGVSLQVCAPDGMTFVKKEDCETPGLCNKMLGKCTDAVCEPGKPSCDGNSLVKCKADGTAIETTTPCGSGTCDAAGGDCNMCQPGTKKCDGDSVATCDGTGQKFNAAPCPSGNKCIGLGQCVQCDSPEDCSMLTMDCKVGACGSGNRCVAQNAPNGTQCTIGGRPGTCSNGTCQCTRQCSGKQCGPDGCGADCGACSKICTSAGRCVQCESSSDCDASMSCTGNTCGCTGTQKMCEGRCISSSGCCSASDCRGSNTTCNGSHQCVCESSNFRQCSGGGCVVTTGCCPGGDSGRSCTSSGGGEGKCDSSGNCKETACNSSCASNLYRPCSQCVSPTTCSLYEVCTINCSGDADCPGGRCSGGQCRRPCSTSNDCLTGTNCGSDGFCAWNGNG
jgi:hypothetical protein